MVAAAMTASTTMGWRQTRPGALVQGGSRIVPPVRRLGPARRGGAAAGGVLGGAVGSAVRGGRLTVRTPPGSPVMGAILNGGCPVDGAAR
jgi:hypothetical protein